MKFYLFWLTAFAFFLSVNGSDVHLVVQSTSASRIHQLYRDFELAGMKNMDLWHPEANWTALRWTSSSTSDLLEGLEEYSKHPDVERLPHASYENAEEKLIIAGIPANTMLSTTFQKRGFQKRGDTYTLKVQQPADTMRVMREMARLHVYDV
jgi:hypothetical protein